MSLSSREGRSLAYCCSRCGADAIATDRDDARLCLICRAAILALDFQTRSVQSLPKKRRQAGWLKMMAAAFGKAA
jgi:hypothetical protein